MDPRTAGGLAHGMANGDHIRHENYELVSAKGPALASAYSLGSDLHPRNLDPKAHDGHTLETPLGGCILEFTYPEGPYPHSSPAAARSLVQETKGPWQQTHLGNSLAWPHLFGEPHS
jgi:hypothetical protein